MFPLMNEPMTYQISLRLAALVKAYGREEVQNIINYTSYYIVDSSFVADRHNETEMLMVHVLNLRASFPDNFAIVARELHSFNVAQKVG